MSYQRAVQEHDVIRSELHRLSDLVGERKPDVGELLAVLAALSAHLDQHLSFERDMLCPRLLEQAGPRVQSLIDGFRLDIDGLKLLVRHFLNDWTAECIDSDIDGFQDEARTLTTTILRQFAAEEEGVYPLALQYGVIRLREH